MIRRPPRSTQSRSSAASDVYKRQGWVGQLAGGAFGTAIEGYTGQRISEVYGDVRSYVTDPETMNDDVVYELSLLDAFESHGRGLTSQDICLLYTSPSPRD